jgi:cellulose synthase/poly-beta-1,6-N-acetylglucosamine synthase-like glycosyltransferase
VRSAPPGSGPGPALDPVYPADKFEILVIDDASTDQTAEILTGLQIAYQRLRVITIVKNRGKAHGLNVGLAYANGDFLLSNDADTKPNPDALWQFLSSFEREGGQNVGAVTGNILAVNRTTLTAEAQQNELNSIIGLVKRSQMSYGALFTFSGANTMYRKQAVLDVGGWHAEQPTEDIAIAWDMQAGGFAGRSSPRTSGSSSTSPNSCAHSSDSDRAGPRGASTS